jgi:hypothetical protein
MPDVLVSLMQVTLCKPAVQMCRPYACKCYIKQVKRAQMGSRNIAALSLTSALDGGGWSTPRLRPLYPRKRDPVPSLQEFDWASGPVWTVAENVDARTVQTVASRYTDWAIPAHVTGIFMCNLSTLYQLIIQYHDQISTMKWLLLIERMSAAWSCIMRSFVICTLKMKENCTGSV